MLDFFPPKQKEHVADQEKSGKFSFIFFVVNSDIVLNLFIDYSLASASNTVALRNLFTRNDDVGKDFRNNIRAYNNAIAFTSMGVNLDKELANGK